MGPALLDHAGLRRDRARPTSPGSSILRAGVLSAVIDGQHVAAVGDAIPLMATFHDSRAALAAEFEREGYFFLGSRGTQGRVPALRYNLDETPKMRFAGGCRCRPPRQALACAKAALAAPEPADLPAATNRLMPSATSWAGTRSTISSMTGPI